MSVSNRNGTIHAAICLLTRRRPVMLAGALASLDELVVPDNTRVTIVLVENDDHETARQTVETFGSQTGKSVHYVLEKRMGIPFARNAAVRAALAMDADVVLFFDDDEIVDRQWLAHMLDRFRTSHLQLIGGPVFARSATSPEPWVRTQLRRGLADRFERRANKAARLFGKGGDSRITIVTNNWLASRDVFEVHSIEFDGAYAKTGGSDTKFFHDAVAAGVKTGWAPEAKVFETIPSECLTIGYVYKRGRDQKRASVFRKLRKDGRLRLGARLAPELVYRLVLLTPRALWVVLTGGVHLAAFARSTGELAGLFTGFFGARSTLYEQTTGH